MVCVGDVSKELFPDDNGRTQRARARLQHLQAHIHTRIHTHAHTHSPSTHTHTPSGAPTGSQRHFAFDAWRVAQNVAMDFAWFAKDHRQVAGTRAFALTSPAPPCPPYSGVGGAVGLPTDRSATYTSWSDGAFPGTADTILAFCCSVIRWLGLPTPWTSTSPWSAALGMA